uniref:Uncharacterized protein n=1 Tax=Anguilla anguilla TaxID=7936 RepID=A0A0E9R6Q6_ANGAN
MFSLNDTKIMFIIFKCIMILIWFYCIHDRPTHCVYAGRSIDLSNINF